MLRHLLPLLVLLAGCPGKDEDTAVDTDTPPLTDADADGVPLPADCDDADPYTYPGADDIPYDGVDQDCADGDLIDVDGDGYIGALAGGDDCMDSNPTVHPDAPEVCYDGLDNDCSGDVDTDDCDGDGADRIDDCNDEDDTVYPGAADTWYDGIDANCDRESDYDQDADSFDAVGYGDGTDCDDLDPAVNEDAEERWDGVDNDCVSDTDQMSSRTTTGSMYGEGDFGDSWFGHEFAVLDDLDGDGWAEVAAGVPLSGKQNGKVYVAARLDGPTDLATEAHATIDGAGGEALGLSVASIPSSDGDDWLALGTIGSAYLFRSSQLTAGAALAGNDATVELTTDTDGGAVYAWSDGSGRAFGVACTDFYLGLNTQCGVYALDGASGTLGIGDAWFSLTGTGVALGSGAPGDLDGDGIDELMVGGNGFSDSALALLIDGADIAAGGAVSNEGVASMGGLTGVLRAAGGADFDGDGYAELVLSEYQATGTAGDVAGKVHVVSGPTAMLGGAADDIALAHVEGAEAADALRAATGASDIDRDGVADLLVSGPGEGTGEVDGEVWWVSGTVVGAGGTVTPARATPAFYGTGSDDQYGWLVTPADADGDGDDDLFIAVLGGGAGGVLLYTRE